MIRMIAACARNRVMGSKGTLPWKIQEDWEYFLKTTEGGVLLMGRRCYEDFTEYASTRKLVVLSRDPDKTFTHASKAASLKEGIKLAQSMGENIWICGGAEIYKHAMPISEELYLTQIDQDYEGDVKFPAWEDHFETEISRKTVTTDGLTLSFLILGR